MSTLTLQYENVSFSSSQAFRDVGSPCGTVGYSAYDEFLCLIRLSLWAWPGCSINSGLRLVRKRMRLHDEKPRSISVVVFPNYPYPPKTQYQSEAQSSSVFRFRGQTGRRSSASETQRIFFNYFSGFHHWSAKVFHNQSSRCFYPRPLFFL